MPPRAAGDFQHKAGGGEDAAQHGEKDSFAGMIAVATAILATIGALFSYMGGATQANAGLFKNNAAIKKTEASNQWNYYQAKSSKQNLAELAAVLVADIDLQHVPFKGTPEAVTEIVGGLMLLSGRFVPLGLLLLALGMAGLLTGGRQTITINPRTRQITVEDVTRLGAKTRCIGFDEIVDISIGYLGKKSNYVTCYYLMLKLKGGEEYSLFAPGRFYAGGSDRSVVEGWRDRLRGYVAN